MNDSKNHLQINLFANYEANVKYQAIENVPAITEFLQPRTSPKPCRQYTCFLIDLTRTRLLTRKRLVVAGCLQLSTPSVTNSSLNTNWKTLSCHSPHFLLGQVREINWFLEQVIATADQELTSRKVSFLLQTPQQDGGQWDMVVASLRNTVSFLSLFYPESVSSSSSRELNAILNKLLRQDAQILRDLSSGADQSDCSTRKKTLQEIFNFLAMSLGLPPRQFDFCLSR